MEGDGTGRSGQILCSLCTTSRLPGRRHNSHHSGHCPGPWCWSPSHHDTTGSHPLYLYKKSHKVEILYVLTISHQERDLLDRALEFHLTYLGNLPHAACTFLLLFLPQQTCRTRRRPSSHQNPPNQLVVCFWSDLSVGGSCSPQARTRRSGHRSLFCSRTSSWRSRRSRWVVSGRQSSPLLHFLGRRKLQTCSFCWVKSCRHS